MLARVRARQGRRARPAHGAHRGVIVAPPLPSVERATERPARSLDPLFRLMAADLERVNALIVARMHSPVALIPQLAGHIVCGRRQAAAAAPDARLCAALRLSRRAACRDRRGRRIHPHRDPAARRCRRRQRVAARPRHRQCGVGQQAGGAGRRFPVRPLVSADGRGRIAARPRNPVARRVGDRRGRSAPADDRQRHDDDRRRPISR